MDKRRFRESRAQVGVSDLGVVDAAASFGAYADGDRMCALCGGTHATRKAWNACVRWHRKGHACGYCGREFGARRDCRRHEVTHSSASRAMLVCDCGVTFTRRDNLLRHVQTRCEPQQPSEADSSVAGVARYSPPFGPFDDEEQAGEDGSATASENQITEVTGQTTATDGDQTHIVGFHTE